MPLWQSGAVGGDARGDFDVVVVGSANIDLVAGVEAFPVAGQTLTALDYAEHPGGKGLNQAVACARMGARTAFVGCVGDDAAGQMLTEVLLSEGIDISGLSVVDGPTGRAFITVDAGGENTIVVVPGANHLLGRGHEVVVPRCGTLLVQLEIPDAAVLGAVAQARAAGARIVLNPAPARLLPAGLVADCDIIVPNEGELELLGGAQVLLGEGAGAVVLTRGSRGAQVITGPGVVYVPPHAVDPVDTVGAGDAFVGAMCAELSRGASLLDACATGAVAGALATTVRGAVPSLPTRDAVRKARSG